MIKWKYIRIILLSNLILTLVLLDQPIVFKVDSQLPNVDIKWTYKTNAPNFSSPAIADLTNDNKLDAVFSSKGNTFALTSNGELIWNNTAIQMQYSDASPAIIDIDNDDSLEIIVDSYNYGIYCLNCYGEVLWFHEEPLIETPPVISDLEIDGKMEIIAASRNQIFCLNSSGIVKWNYSIEIASSYNTQLALGDLDNSGSVEILINLNSNELLCLNADGTKAWTSSHYGIPVIADLDSDGTQEIILYSFSKITCLDNSGNLFWEYLGGNDFTVLGVANLIDDERKEIIMCSGTGQSVTCLNSQGQWEWSYFTDKKPTSLCIADLNDDRELEIIVGTEYGNLFCISIHKILLWELSFSDEAWELPYPCVMDLDADGILEIVFAHLRTVYCLGITQVDKSGIAPWYCRGGSIFRTGTLDSDGDYIDDLSEETWLQTNKNNIDSDTDGLSDGKEFLYYHTEPTNPDTDGDGALDGEEISFGSDPLNPKDNPSTTKRLVVVKILSIMLPIVGLLLIIVIVSKIYYETQYPKKK